MKKGRDTRISDRGEDVQYQRNFDPPQSAREVAGAPLRSNNIP